MRQPEVQWHKVEMFHLDEYIGLSVDHPASFRKYLLERLIRPAGITRYHLLDGEHDGEAVCRDVGRQLQQDAHQHFDDDTSAPDQVDAFAEPLRIGASLIPLVGMTALLVLVRNTDATKRGIVNEI